MDVFLYAPEQFENLCVLSRTLEVFGFSRCYVYDPHRIVRERYGKSYAQRLRTVSAGAFQKIAWQRVDGDIAAFLRGYEGRRVATVSQQNATSLHEFRFRHSDLLLIGSEGAGSTPAFWSNAKPELRFRRLALRRASMLPSPPASYSPNGNDKKRSVCSSLESLSGPRRVRRAGLGARRSDAPGLRSLVMHHWPARRCPRAVPNAP